MWWSNPKRRAGSAALWAAAATVIDSRPNTLWQVHSAIHSSFSACQQAPRNQIAVLPSDDKNGITWNGTQKKKMGWLCFVQFLTIVFFPCVFLFSILGIKVTREGGTMPEVVFYKDTFVFPPTTFIKIKMYRLWEKRAYHLLIMRPIQSRYTRQKEFKSNKKLLTGGKKPRHVGCSVRKLIYPASQWDFIESLYLERPERKTERGQALLERSFC